MQVYGSMLEIEKAYESDKLNLEDEDREELMEIFRSRWEKLHHPLHSAGYMLEPQFRHVNFDSRV